ncbi:18526_t:CDS:2, partial [Racocetra fulgida]
IAGDAKHQIGKVKTVDMFTNRVWVDGVKGRKTSPNEISNASDQSDNKVCGTDNVIIPFPPRPEKSEYKQEKLASEMTWSVSKDYPLPPGVIDELRDRHKPWRYNYLHKNRPFV